jgi:purine-nucleoside phosphorylase
MEASGIPRRIGKSVSVPATFWHGDERRIDPNVLALELELASLCYCAKKLGMKAAGLLVISDTREQRLVDKRPSIDSTMINVFQSLRSSLQRS